MAVRTTSHKSSQAGQTRDLWRQKSKFRVLSAYGEFCSAQNATISRLVRANAFSSLQLCGAPVLPNNFGASLLGSKTRPCILWYVCV
jgi:hypothetical protein